MLPSTAARLVTLPLKGTPVLPGGFQLPVVLLTVPLVPETTPCLIFSTGSATDTITATSEEISVRSVRVVCWLDCASTSSERWSANGWSPTRTVKRMTMRLPVVSAVAKLPKSKTTELPSALVTLTTPPALVLPGPSCHWPTSLPVAQVTPPTLNKGNGRYAVSLNCS
ncbi:hypothetical protein D3C81_1574760 [compost metagenome]